MVVSPDRYGRFGHQTTSVAAGLLLARVTNAKLLEPKYMYFCDKWNPYADFSKSKYVTRTVTEGASICFLEKSVPDAYGNRKWDFNDKSEIHAVINMISAIEDNTIIWLPFDQSAGLLLNLLNNQVVRDDFKQVYHFDGLGMSFNHPYACVHIRRGDCTIDSHPTWYVEDRFYTCLIDMLTHTLPPEYYVVVCTQGDCAWLRKSEIAGEITSGRVIIRTTDQLFMNDSEIEDFYIMKEASIIVCAASSFSDWAAYLGNHILAINISRTAHHALRNMLTLNPDGCIQDTINVARMAIANQFS